MGHIALLYRVTIDYSLTMSRLISIDYRYFLCPQPLGKGRLFLYRSDGWYWRFMEPRKSAADTQVVPHLSFHWMDCQSTTWENQAQCEILVNSKLAKCKRTTQTGTEAGDEQFVPCERVGTST